MKKKGFTLIELLAVIVILAVIALIVTPVITGIIESTEMSAFIQSGSSIVNAVETECSTSILKNGNKNIAYYFDGDKPQDIKVKGKLPTAGGVMTNDKCQASLNINDGVHCAVKSANSNTVIGGKLVDGVCVSLEETKTSLPANSDPNPGTFRGTGTLEEPFLIESVEDLFATRLLSYDNTDGKHFKLNLDIDFKDDNSYADPSTKAFGDINCNGVVEDIKTECTTSHGFIGGPGNTFNGSFDGNNKVIKNLYINDPTRSYVGLFPRTARNNDTTDPMYFKNITFENSTVLGNTYTGTLIGSGYNKESPIEFSNIHVLGSINGNMAGGIIGDFASNNNDLFINNSTFNGNIKCTNGYCGGIIGNRSTNGAYTIFENIKVSTSIASKGQYVGGISGKDYKQKMYNVYAYGEIVDLDDDGINTYNGGINGTSISEGHDIYNFVNINKPKGRYCYGIDISGPAYNIYNYGNISAGDTDAFGIVGLGKCVNCYNYGNITSAKSGSIGIDIYTSDSNSILGECINCANYGKITGDSNTYGIVSPIIKNSLNFGDIECGTSCTSFMGSTNNSEEIPLTITNSYSIGNVKETRGYDSLANLGGLSKSITSTNNVFIKSDMTATKSKAGGICSILLSGGSLNNTAFIGSVTKDASSNANLTVLENRGNLNNVYYSQVGGNVSTGVGTSVPIANITTSWFKDTLKLGNNFQYEDGYYPRVYKLDSNGVVTNELVEGQTKVAIR